MLTSVAALFTYESMPGRTRKLVQWIEENPSVCPIMHAIACSLLITEVVLESFKGISVHTFEESDDD